MNLVAVALLQFFFQAHCRSGSMAARTMPKTQRNLTIFIALSLVAITAGCTGFFTNPVLQTVTVGPTNLNLQQGSTQQMTATGTFDDGSTKTLTSGVFWSSSDTTVAPVSNSGVVSGAASGTATITAEDGTVSGQATVNVALANVTAINITPTSATAQPNGGIAKFMALATVQGQSQQIDVSSNVTWSTSDPNNVTITQGQSPAIVTVGNVSPEVVTITATYNSTTTLTATATLTVN
jgi:trimeric autotransporter adhesin